LKRHLSCIDHESPDKNKYEKEWLRVLFWMALISALAPNTKSQPSPISAARYQALLAYFCSVFDTHFSLVFFLIVSSEREVVHYLVVNDKAILVNYRHCRTSACCWA
jgi:hypothetical protein